MNPTPLCLALATALVIPASAATLYNEVTQGELAQGVSAPILQPSVGTNVVSGTVSYTTVLLDIDQFSFVVQPGQFASNMVYSFSNAHLMENEQVSGNVWIYAGTVSTGLTYLTNLFWIARAPGSIYGQSSVSPADINTGTLGPGAYTVSIAPNGRSINGGEVPYSLSFNITGVPEPSCALLLILSGAGLIIHRRRA